jgi:hypothetical protein
MTRESSARRALPGLLAGLVLLDLLVNLPGFDPASAASTLLIPSLDLLIFVALCLGIAQAGEASWVPLRIAAVVLAVFLMAWKIGARFGPDLPWKLFGDGPAILGVAGCVVSLAAAAAAGVALFLLSGLVVRGFLTAMARNGALLVIAAAVIIHVLLKATLFAPSIVPRIIRDIGSLMR